MKKLIYSLLLVALSSATLFLITSCKKENLSATSIFNNGSSQRDMIVVISDLHLGANMKYAEINKNLKPLEQLLIKIRKSANVKELVIAGDLLDEWFVPANVDTYNGKDQSDFVQRIATTNKVVIDQFNNIIQDGKILVTYVPGNHDITISAQNVDLILPGVNQARDSILGLGTYTPTDFPELAIEHGHRYNIFCAPDPFSNQDIAPGTILPPGYFFTRIATTHVMQQLPAGEGVVTPITPNASGDESQTNLYKYWELWEWALNLFTLKNDFSEKMIITNVNGFTGTYSINDLLPSQAQTDGEIKVNLYNGIQDNWVKRQELNQVEKLIDAGHAFEFASNDPETDSQANLQYFSNTSSNKRVVIFGHSHVARIDAYENHQGEKSIYANSGTWIDHNPKGATATFVVITPQDEKASSQTFVKLYSFENEVIKEIAKDSLHI